MCSENYISLIKGLACKLASNRGYENVIGRNINFTPNPDLVGASSLVDTISSYFGDLKNKYGNLTVVNFGYSQIDQKMVFEARLSKSVLEDVSNILPQPYFQIEIKIPPSSSDADNNMLVFNARLEIADILAETPFADYRRLCSTSFSACFGKETKWDLTLGWVYPVEGMKINSATFLQTLFQREASKDLTIVAGNKAEQKCHKIIFEAHSDVLARMVSPDNGMKESTSGRITMTENSEEGISHLLRYLYGMELAAKDLSCDIAVELFKTAHKYKLPELLECLGELLVQMRKDWYSPDDLMELYFHVKNLDEFGKLPCLLKSKNATDSKKLKVLMPKRPRLLYGYCLIW